MQITRKIFIRAPATTANLGPGFDVFGMALEQPNDIVKISALPPEEGIRIKVYGHAGSGVPADPRKNTAGVVAEHILKEFSINSGVFIEIEKGIMPGFGLGSSAASAAAAAYGLNILFNLNLDKRQLVYFAAKGEKASAGFEHADNVSAAIYGGFVIIRTYDPLEVIHLEAPADLIVCVAIPKLFPQPKKTEKARSVLPQSVPLDKLRHNVGHASSMAVGFATGDVGLIGRSMCDAIVEPARASLIPGYELVKNEAIKAGAYGVAISGAGPSMIALIPSDLSLASKVAEAMRRGFQEAGVPAEAFYTKPGKGVTLLEAL